MNILDQVIRNIKDLKTLPTVYTRLTEIMADPRSTTTDAALTISGDQAAAAKILRVANSPVYAISGRVDSIAKAIFFLGFSEVKNLVLAISIMDMFGKGGNVVFNPSDFWKYSIAVGVCSRLLAKEIKAPDVEQYFVGGIIHGIGKLFIYENFPTEFQRIVQMCKEENKLMRNAERELLGFNHLVLGEMIAEHWKLPVSMRVVLRNYHTGLVGSAHNPLVSAVHLASIIVQCMRLGNSCESIVDRVNPLAAGKLQISGNAIAKLSMELRLEYEEMIAVMNLNN